MSGHRKKKHTFIGTVIKTVFILAAVIIVCYAGYGIAKKKVEQKAAQMIVTQLAESDTSGNSDAADAQKVYNSMSTEDQEKVQKIVDDHLNAGTASKVKEYIQNGDTQALKEYTEENLSEDEKSQLTELYDKYR